MSLSRSCCKNNAWLEKSIVFLYILAMENEKVKRQHVSIQKYHIPRIKWKINYTENFKKFSEMKKIQIDGYIIFIQKIVVKKSVFAKLIYRFNMIPIKIHDVFWEGGRKGSKKWQLILRYKWKSKWLSSWRRYWRKNKRGFILLHIKSNLH